MAQKIFIDGEAGTTGLQIRERLADRRDIELLSIPEDRRKDPSARAEFLHTADVAILCLPDDAARESVALIGDADTRVIDASSAHRTAEGWTYGFAEMRKKQSDRIAEAKLVTNPGCWPQGPIAVLRPLIKAGLLPQDFSATINGISGYSGGGKSMIAEYEGMGESAPQFLPYGLTFAHKHMPELSAYTKLSRGPVFVPAVGNYYKGMLTSVPVDLSNLAGAPKVADLHAALADYYAGIADSFVEVAPLVTESKLADIQPEALNGSNRMRLYVAGDDAKGQAALIAVYDNLGKGASGAAVQNLNLMIGADPKAGL